MHYWEHCAPWLEPLRAPNGWTLPAQLTLSRAHLVPKPAFCFLRKKQIRNSCDRINSRDHSLTKNNFILIFCS